jgi:hypothetical protein
LRHYSVWVYQKFILPRAGSKAGLKGINFFAGLQRDIFMPSDAEIRNGKLSRRSFTTASSPRLISDASA